MNNLDKKIRSLKAEDNQRLVCAALKWNSDTYSKLVFETGLEWIKNNLSLNDDEIVGVIAKCRLFWAWWRNQWDLRDEQFIYETSLRRQELPLEGCALLFAGDIYNDMNSLRTVKLVPNRFVTGEINTALKVYNQQELERLKTLIYAKR